MVNRICLCPLDGVLRKYENVAVCENGRYLLKEFRVDMENGLYHIAVEMDLQLMELEKNKLKPRKEYIRMTLSKDITSIGGLENDAQMFRCNRSIKRCSFILSYDIIKALLQFW